MGDDVMTSKMSQRGDGITRIQGFVTFVAGARTGEHLKIKVIEVGSRFEGPSCLAKFRRKRRLGKLN